jgi:hypothetical protein
MYYLFEVIAFSGEAEVPRVKSLLNVQPDIELFSGVKKSYRIFFPEIWQEATGRAIFSFPLNFPLTFSYPKSHTH